ncbi:MAG TPA: helix-turn-helix domain-containing protein [Gaiellaceae bacterium]|nr:helix-turn-helix domain-containing protein [Gaiellaceae bacterium]
MTTLRADAQRNLGRVLDAAAEVFAEQGPSASVDEIARRAGVGHATVFRRFPTKDALIRAVVDRRIAELNALADDALHAEDPGAAFTEFVWRAAELGAKDRGLDECFLRCADSPTLTTLRDAGTRITRRAQQAGALRTDIPAREVPELIRAAMRAAAPGQWRRNVQVVLDGLRPRD